MKQSSNTILNKYKNGNYEVTIFSDGTKIKETSDNEFCSLFPDSIDLKITNYCDLLCPMCHENSSLLGTEGDFDKPFFRTLCEGVELAIGGGNPLSHKGLISFLERMKEKKVICNLTINEKHFLKETSLIQDLVDKKLIFGVGISLNEYNTKTIDFAIKNENVVFHLIAGLVTLKELSILYGKKLKILLLGYKTFGRGEKYYSNEIDNNIKTLKDNFYILSGFKRVCFDNLALKELDVKNKIDKDIYEKSFMGEDGTSTMYIDLVKEEFAVSSTSKKRFKLMDNIISMMKKVKEEASNL